MERVSAVETARPAVEPSEAAMRAATCIMEICWQGGEEGNFSAKNIAAIIDRETHYPEMKDALTDVHDELADALGEWVSVEYAFLPADKLRLKQIYSHVSTVLEHLTTTTPARFSPTPAIALEEALDALKDCDLAFANWQVGQIPGRPEDILALITKVRNAIRQGIEYADRATERAVAAMRDPEGKI